MRPPPAAQPSASSPTHYRLSTPVDVGSGRLLLIPRPVDLGSGRICPAASSRHATARSARPPVASLYSIDLSHAGRCRDAPRCSSSPKLLRRRGHGPHQARSDEVKSGRARSPLRRLVPSHPLPTASTRARREEILEQIEPSLHRLEQILELDRFGKPQPPPSPTLFAEWGNAGADSGRPGQGIRGSAASPESCRLTASRSRCRRVHFGIHCRIGSAKGNQWIREKPKR